MTKRLLAYFVPLYICVFLIVQSKHKELKFANCSAGQIGFIVRCTVPDNKTSDIELVNGIRKGDSSSLKLLFDRYYAGLFYFAITISKSQEIADESVSDVFLNIWLKRKTLSINTGIKSYLYSAVKNQSINYLRQNGRLNLNTEELTLDNLVSDLHADQTITDQELLSGVDSLLNQLPEKRRLVFKMNRFDGLSYKEIAEILSISVSTVQNQMVKAVEFLSARKSYLKKLF